MPPRTLTLLAVAAALVPAAAASPPASAAAQQARSCDSPAGRTLDSDGSSRLFSRVTNRRAPQETSFYACWQAKTSVKVRRIARDVESPDGGGLGGGWLVGSRYAVLRDTYNGPDYQAFSQRVYDVKTGRLIRVLSLPQHESASVYTRSGGVLYLDEPDASGLAGPTIELVAIDADGRRVVATLPRLTADGGAIDHGLAVAGNRVYWMEGEVAKSAVLRGRMTSDE